MVVRVHLPRHNLAGGVTGIGIPTALKMRVLAGSNPVVPTRILDH